MSDRIPWGMTLRELLKALHAVDEKHLDMEVVVSPASGGYESISHTSVLYVGHPVIHLAEPKPAEVPEFWSGLSDAVAVNPDDLRNVWAMLRDFQLRAGGHQCVIDSRMFEPVCSPGANIMGVWYRASMLGMLQMLPDSPLARWTHGGELDDAVFQVAATFPMKKLQVGVIHDGPPFDVQEFLKQVGRTNK